MAELIVGLRRDVARRLQQGERNPAAEVFGVLEESGFQLQAMHPESDDPELQPWFSVNVDDDQAVELASRLLDLGAVTAAYVKPADSAP